MEVVQCLLDLSDRLVQVRVSLQAWEEDLQPQSMSTGKTVHIHRRVPAAFSQEVVHHLCVSVPSDSDDSSHRDQQCHLRKADMIAENKRRSNSVRVCCSLLNCRLRECLEVHRLAVGVHHYCR